MSIDSKSIKDIFSIKCKDNILLVPDEITKWGNIIKINIYCDNVFLKTLNIFDFRTRLGRMKFKSYKFEIHQKEQGFFFTGSGFGHRVGLCQYGANEMIKAGYSYKDVLNYYFPDVDILKLQDIWNNITF